MPISIENSPFWCDITIYYITQASSDITIFYVTQASSNITIYYVTQASNNITIYYVIQATRSNITIYYVTQAIVGTVEVTVQQKWNSSQTFDTILAPSSAKIELKPDTGHLEVNVPRISCQRLYYVKTQRNAPVWYDENLLNSHALRTGIEHGLQK
ncbi:hypothetical protein DPMN_003733 [Dreissena polymorpha]|uniref:Uncharacterized protein n=1 Tax=Dreissena polymorpha TaxID=45954 RepID=A0A9D4RSC6_DREPO|nr:hypothetical protein DPMN_003733 [Dreissena polymorpha]